MSMTLTVTFCNGSTSYANMGFERPKYDFSVIADSSLFHISHRLWDNHIRTFEILPTSIFNLEIEVQGHVEQCRRLYIGCQIYSVTIQWEMQVLSQTVVWLNSGLHSYTIGRLSHVKQDNFEIFILKIFVKVTHFECKKKQKHIMVAKLKKNEPLCAYVGPPVWPLTFTKKEEKDTVLVFDKTSLEAFRLGAYRPALAASVAAISIMCWADRFDSR